MIYIYGCVVRVLRRSFRLSRLVYRLLQFQERLFKDPETHIILTAFLSSSTSTSSSSSSFLLVGHCGCLLSLFSKKKRPLKP